MKPKQLSHHAITAGGAIWVASLTYGTMNGFDVEFLIGEGTGIVLAFTGILTEQRYHRKKRDLLTQLRNLERIRAQRPEPDANDTQETFEQKVLLGRAILRIRNEIEDIG